MIPLIYINALREHFKGKQMTFVIRYHNISDYVGQYFVIIAEGIYLLTPFWTMGLDGHSFRYTLLAALVSNMISSLVFGLQFVVNHEVESVHNEENAAQPHKVYLDAESGGKAAPRMKSTSSPESSEDGRRRVNSAAIIDWGEFQMQESATFNPEKTFSLELAGGLNTQVEHHLFPQIHYSHYNNLTPIIKRVAARFNVPYNYTDSWVGAITSHYEVLKNPPVSVR